MAVIFAGLVVVAAATPGTLTIDGNLTYYGGPECQGCLSFSATGRGVIRGLGAARYAATGNTDMSDPACGKSTEQFDIEVPGKGGITLNGTVEGGTETKPDRDPPWHCGTNISLRQEDVNNDPGAVEA